MMTSDSQEMVLRRSQAPSSWVNRVTREVDRSRLPAPLWYIIGGLVSIALFALNDWLMLGRPREAVTPFHIVLALGPAYTLGFMHLLDFRAGHALARMRSLLKSPEIYLELHRRLTTLPPRETLVASFAGAFVGVLAVVIERTALPSAFRPFLPAEAARPFVEVWLVFSWFVFGALFIHSVHQLRYINRIYTHHTTIDMDQYQLLFHFSKVSALTAIGLLAIPYAWVAAIPHLLNDNVGYAFGAIFSVFALLSFLWPLIGVHNLMVEAKARALHENAVALKEIRRQLFEQVNLGAVGEATDFHDTLAAIRGEREALLHVPTWPWQPGTPRSVAAALALPLIVWMLQWVLQKFLGG